MKLYLDTSVFGGLFDSAFVDETKSFFKTIERDKLKICVSELVERELLRAPDHVLNFYMSLGTEWLDIDRDVLQLAKKYILAGALPQKCFMDAQHIACATVHNASAIVSWNFKHIVNLKRENIYNGVNITNGYRTIGIYSPLNFFNQTNHDDK